MVQFTNNRVAAARMYSLLLWGPTLSSMYPRRHDDNITALSCVYISSEGVYNVS